MRRSFYFPFYGFIIGLVVLAADIFSKYWISENIVRGFVVFQDFLGIDFNIVHSTNRGAAWSILSNYQLPLLVFRIVLVSVLFVYLFFFNKKQKYVTPLTLIAFGAVGNIIDYFLYGHVIDMFHFVFWGYSYPVFNIADAVIFIGIFWILLLPKRFAV